MSVCVALRFGGLETVLGGCRLAFSRRPSGQASVMHGFREDRGCACLWLARRRLQPAENMVGSRVDEMVLSESRMMPTPFFPGRHVFHWCPSLAAWLDEYKYTIYFSTQWLNLPEAFRYPSKDKSYPNYAFNGFRVEYGICASLLWGEPPHRAGEGDGGVEANASGRG